MSLESRKSFVQSFKMFRVSTRNRSKRIFSICKMKTSFTHSEEKHFPLYQDTRVSS